MLNVCTSPETSEFEGSTHIFITEEIPCGLSNNYIVWSQGFMAVNRPESDGDSPRTRAVYIAINPL